MTTRFKMCSTGLREKTNKSERTEIQIKVMVNALSYFSTAVIKHHNQDNLEKGLFGMYSFHRDRSSSPSSWWEHPSKQAWSWDSS